VTHQYEFKIYALGVASLPGAKTTGRPSDVIALIQSAGAVVDTATLRASYTGE
jgi:hypothetical protein